MTDSDKIPFAKLMGELSIAFGRDPNREMMAVYFKRLRKFTLYQVSMAVDSIIESDSRFPIFSRVHEVAGTFKREPPDPNRHLLQIEEMTCSNDMPKTKEEFFEAMDKLANDQGISTDKIIDAE